MKLFVCLLFLICFTYIYPDCYSSTDLTQVKKDVCLARKVGDSEYPEVTGHKPDTCCHEKISYKLNGVKFEFSSCGAYEKSKVEDYIKKQKENKNDYGEGSEILKVTNAKYSLDCSSSFVQFGFFALLTILF